MSGFIEFKNVSKRFGKVEVLHDINLTIHEKEVVVIVGPSGSGKSTLLRCINRLIDATEGEILWDGVNLCDLKGEDLRNARRKIGMVFQSFNLVERSSVWNNVMSGRLGYTGTMKSLFGRFSKDDMEMGRKVIERLDITQQMHKRADELSGGQQQRVGIARALMQEPELILADEPVASLDPVLAHSILRTLEQLNQEDELTVVCSLHYLDLVQRYATSVVGLRDGEIVYEGTHDEIRKLTDDEFKNIYGAEAERVGASIEGSL